MRNSTDVDQWCFQRRLVRELRNPMITLDYPITLEVGRYDPETDTEWTVGQFEVIAHLEEGIGRGWSLADFSYHASKWDHRPPQMKIEDKLILATGTRPLDVFIEREIKDHLARHRLHVDEAWDEEVRKARSREAESAWEFSRERAAAE